MKSTPHYDSTIKREQSQILLTPKSPRAEAWCSAYLVTNPKFGSAFIIADRDFGKVANALLEADLTVERED